MVAVLFGQCGGIVVFTLGDLHHLGSTGFAAHAVFQTHADFSCGSARLQYFGHRRFDVVEITLLERQDALRFRVDQGDLLFIVIQQLFDQVRAVNHAVVGQGGGGVGHLQRGIGVIALADADRHHFGYVPAASFGRQLGKPFFFPFGRGEYAAVFVRQIDTGLLAEIEFRQIRTDFLNAHFKSESVEKGIRGNLDGFA